MATPKQKMYQVAILSRLLEGPLRFNALWYALKPQLKSRAQLSDNLGYLEKKGMIKRLQKSHKHVTYRIARKFVKGDKSEQDLMLSFAMRLTPFGSVELIADAMEFLISGEIFEDEEEAMQAAIGFWVERYRNLCVLDALFSLMEKQNNSEDFALELRKSYQVNEDKFFAVILGFKEKRPHLFRVVLEKKLFLMGIDLRPSWISVKLEEFLRTHYPKAYEKLSDRDKADIYFNLLAKEKEKEYIHCLKYKKEIPRGVCKLCGFFKFSPTYGRFRCRYQRIPSVREKILSRRRKEWPKDLTQ